MDKWIKYRKGHSNIAYTPDVIVASVLRLIGKSLPACLAALVVVRPLVGTEHADILALQCLSSQGCALLCS